MLLSRRLGVLAFLNMPLLVSSLNLIFKTKNLRIVLHLGGFHSLKSFVGGAGFSMKGSGLEKVLETVMSMVLHCNFLVDITLQLKLVKYLLPETAAGINEKVTEETTDQNVSNGTPHPFRQPLLSEEVDELKTLFYTLGKSEIDPVNLEQ